MPHIKLTRSQRRAMLVTLWLLALVLPLMAGCSTVTTGEETPSSPVGQIVPSRLALVHTGAIRGNFDAEKDGVGLAAVVAYANSLEEEGYDVVLLDSGDSLLGSDLVDITDGENAVGFFNTAGYDAIALGSSELSLSRRLLATRVSQSEATLLSANATSVDESSLPGQPNTTITLSDGRVIGIFGISSTRNEDEATPLDAGVVSSDEAQLVDVAQQQVADLRAQGCKLVVCLSNLGQGSQTLDARGLAAKVSGIDIVLDAGTEEASHAAQEDASGEETLVVETPGGLVGASAVFWEQGTLSAVTLGQDELDSTDEQTQALVTQTMLEQQSWLASEVATSDKALSRKNVGTRECPLGDLAADALIWEARRAGSRVIPDVAVIDAASIKEGLPEGPITRADLLAICPHTETRLYTVRLSGQQLHDLLGAALGSSAAPDDFPQVAGITASINKKGKLSIEKVGETAFSPTASYLAVVSEHIAAGEGAYHDALTDATELTSLDTSAGKALIGYLGRACHASLPDSYHKAQERITMPSSTNRQKASS